jgi:hypothetical protein
LSVTLLTEKPNCTKISNILKNPLPLPVKLQAFPDCLLHVWQDGFVPQLDEPVPTSGDVIHRTGHEGSQPDEGVRAAGVALHDLVSISPTFYELLLRQNPFRQKIQTQIVST